VNLKCFAFVSVISLLAIAEQALTGPLDDAKAAFAKKRTIRRRLAFGVHWPKVATQRPKGSWEFFTITGWRWPEMKTKRSIGIEKHPRKAMHRQSTGSV